MPSEEREKGAMIEAHTGRTDTHTKIDGISTALVMKHPYNLIAV